MTMHMIPLTTLQSYPPHSHDPLSLLLLLLLLWLAIHTIIYSVLLLPSVSLSSLSAWGTLIDVWLELELESVRRSRAIDVRWISWKRGLWGLVFMVANGSAHGRFGVKHLNAVLPSSSSCVCEEGGGDERQHVCFVVCTSKEQRAEQRSPRAKHG
jgi:hypothetical protein